MKFNNRNVFHISRLGLYGQHLIIYGKNFSVIYKGDLLSYNNLYYYYNIGHNYYTVPYDHIDIRIGDSDNRITYYDTNFLLFSSDIDMKKLFLFLFMLAGCSEEVPIYLSDAQYIDRNIDLVHEATDILGLYPTFVDFQHGAIELEFLEYYQWECVRKESGHLDAVGLAKDSVGCHRFGYVSPDPDIIAHELGHLIADLQHHPSEKNIMYYALRKDQTLNNDQYEEIMIDLNLFRACSLHNLSTE